VRHFSGRSWKSIYPHNQFSNVYDTNAANTILRSCSLTAGTNDVTVSFDWEEAGGETDATDSTIFDYGELLYSIDGKHMLE
jgi:hypothetical protein